SWHHYRGECRRLTTPAPSAWRQNFRYYQFGENMMAKTIFLIRHAEPRVRNGRKQSLTKKGGEQAGALANILATELEGQSDITIYHSPVARCQETATILGEKLGFHTTEAPLRLRGADSLNLQEAQSKMSQ